MGNKGSFGNSKGGEEGRKSHEVVKWGLEGKRCRFMLTARKG